MKWLRRLLRVPEIRSRIGWTLGLLAVWRIGSHLPLPGLNADAIQAFADSASQSMGGFWALLQMFSGGAIGHLAVGSLSIAPYITASIILQLLTKLNPTLEAIAKEGARGQKQIRQYTLYATVPICLVQASIAVSQLSAMPGLVPAGFAVRVLLVAGLTAGSLFTVWLGEQITDRGLGNGSSILIMAGIASRLPAMLPEMGLRGVVILGAALVATVFLSLAQRRIPLHHSGHIRGRRVEISARNYLPLKLLGAGVMPIVFASAMLVLPALVALIPGLEAVRAPFERAGFVFTAYQVVAVLVLSYLWSYLYFNPDEVALQLREHGALVPGLRPGEKTAAYLNGILARLTLCGAVCLAALALLPSGSALLIAVGVALDIARRLEHAVPLADF